MKFKERLRALGRYQKAVLIILAVMLAMFTVLYPVTLSREGYLYGDALLVPERTDGATLYTGRVGGRDAAFTVYDGGEVEYRLGDRFFGPYTVEEDPSAVPEGDELDRVDMTGIVLRCGDETVYRGGMKRLGDGRIWLYPADGSSTGATIVAYAGGKAYDGLGNEIDPDEPSAHTILELMSGPELEHKGQAGMWILGAILCAFCAVSILFTDELFRHSLRFQIRNADDAEPSDWEIASRYISWTMVPVFALAVFIMGLR